MSLCNFPSLLGFVFALPIPSLTVPTLSIGFSLAINLPACPLD